MKHKSRNGKSTQERLLDAAEHLFAEQGIQATSLREITEEAGANLAAVNYHFRSKKALTKAVFERRFVPLNQERLRLLDKAEAEARGTPPAIEEILFALFEPTVRLWKDHEDFLRLDCRVQIEPETKLHEFFLEQFEEVIRRFSSAMVRTVPDVPRKELFWRMHFLFGGMLNTLVNHKDLALFSEGLCVLDDHREFLQRLIAFGAAGLRGPINTPE